MYTPALSSLLHVAACAPLTTAATVQQRNSWCPVSSLELINACSGISCIIRMQHQQAHGPTPRRGPSLTARASALCSTCAGSCFTRCCLPRLSAAQTRQNRVSRHQPWRLRWGRTIESARRWLRRSSCKTRHAEGRSRRGGGCSVRSSHRHSLSAQDQAPREEEYLKLPARYYAADEPVKSR